MQRRTFLGSTWLAGAAALGSVASNAQAGEAENPQGSEAAAPPERKVSNKQYLELRQYHMTDADARGRFEDFLGKAAIPAWNEAGVRQVGVFAYLDDSSPDLFVLLPYASADQVVEVRRKAWAAILGNQEVADVVGAPKAKPAYQRIESRFMLAFDGVPEVQVPEKTEGRLFQLRTYESHSQAKAFKKVEMFNEGGELDIFRAVGMAPVFFGETLIGPNLPNLTYMLTFPDTDAQKTAWKKFLAHPKWKVLSKAAEYVDTVSHITNIMLRPAACSQI